tara:strand:+ start:1358 stop:2263 length:906 start_codon:yes stop_codon:yes gene_type:complete
MDSTQVTVSSIIDSTSVANRAMKFKLSRGGTARRVRDKDAEAMIKAQLGDEGQIVSREFFSDSNNPVHKYQELSGRMYAYHVKETLPLDDSWRILMSAKIFDYTNEMQNYISQLGQLADNIVANWSQLVQDDINLRNAKLKNQSAKVSDYPSATQMRHRLYVVWTPGAINPAGDFRFEVPQALKDRAELAFTNAIESANRDRYNRMLLPVTKFIEKLSKYTGEKGQKWHASFIDNLNSLDKEVGSLNIVDDPVVDAFLQQINSIVGPYAFAPDALKEDQMARDSVRAKLEALESQLKGYVF